MFAEYLIRLIAGLFVGVWVARYLGPNQFGIFSYCVAFVAIFGSLAKLGLDGILVRNLVRDPASSDYYLGTAYWLKLGGASISLCAVATTLSFTVQDTNTTLYIFIIAIGLSFQSFEVIDFYFQSKVLSKFVAGCKMIQLMISSIIKVCLVLVEAPLVWFVMICLFDQIFLAALFYFAYRMQGVGTFLRHFDLKIAKHLLKDSWPLIFSGLVIMIYMRIDQVMIKQILTERDVGLYSAAVRISELCYFIPIIITNSLFPSIINAKKKNEYLYNQRIQSLYSLMFWTAIAIALPVSLCSDWLVVLLFGGAYQEAGRVLTVHIWAIVFVFLGVASGRWFISENLQRFSTIYTVIGAIANVTLNIFLIPMYGIYGAAISTLASYCMAAYLMNFVFEKTRLNFYRMSKSILISR